MANSRRPPRTRPDKGANVTEWVDQIRDYASRAVPPVEGEVKVAGLEKPVEVLRDPWGVPHVYAQNLHDLFFAQGFVIASERLWQLDVMLRLAGGRLSELVSEMALPIDRFFRMLGFNRAARKIAASYDEEDLTLVRANMEGIRAWIDQMRVVPVEYRILDLQPEFPEG